jgi:hypothetical protein
MKEIAHIVSMRDGKEYLKPNINKWWIPPDLLQL